MLAEIVTMLVFHLYKLSIMTSLLWEGLHGHGGFRKFIVTALKWMMLSPHFNAKCQPFPSFSWVQSTVKAWVHLHERSRWIYRNTICVKWRMCKPHPEHKEQAQRCCYTPNRDSNTWRFIHTSPDGGGGRLHALCVARSRSFSLVGRLFFSFTAGGQTRSRGHTPAEPTPATSAALSLSEKKETKPARYVEWNCMK